MWIGIDPGQKGAIASIDHDCKLTAFPMLEPYPLAEYFKENQANIIHVYLERAQSMHGQGIKSAFSYAEHYGQIQGILIAMSIPHTLVPPREWQKMMFLGTKAKDGDKKRDPKQRALEAADRVFAKKRSFWLKSLRSKKPHDGMIDASLIAEACRRSVS